MLYTRRVKILALLNGSLALTRACGEDSKRKWATLHLKVIRESRPAERSPARPVLPAYSLSGATPSAIPILIAVPHAGRAYPGPLLRDMRHPEIAALKLEDRYVDRLARDVATAAGARLLVANAPRAMIDLNRAPDDIDWEMFGKDQTPGNRPARRQPQGAQWAGADPTPGSGRWRTVETVPPGS